MLVQFFLHLKSFRLPVSTREFLTLLEALNARVVSTSLDVPSGPAIVWMLVIVALIVHATVARRIPRGAQG